GGVRAKSISSGLETGGRLERDRPAKEDEWVLSDPAPPPQQVGNIQDAKARRDVHRLLLLQRARRFEPRLANRKRNPARDREQDQQREDRIANDHQGIARAPRAAGRHYHLLWLQPVPRRARGQAGLILPAHRAAGLWLPGCRRVKPTPLPVS